MSIQAPVCSSVANRSAYPLATAGWAECAMAAARRSTTAHPCPAANARGSPGILSTRSARSTRRPGAHWGIGHRRPDHPGPRAETSGVLAAGNAAPEPGMSDRCASDSGWRPVLRGLRRHRPDSRRRRLRPGHSRRAQRGRRIGAAAEYRRRSGYRAHAHAAARVDNRRASRLRRRTPRARSDDRHDQLCRRNAGGIGRARRNPGAPRLPRIPVQRSGFVIRALRPDQGPARFGHHPAGVDHARRRHHPSSPRSHRIHHRRPGHLLRGDVRPQACIHPSTRCRRCRG